MDTNAYWTVRGRYAERKAALSEMPKEQLEATILDSEYNDFLSDRADYRDEAKDKHGHGKRIPYVGWFWRHVSFSQPDRIPIGDCGEFIGFMENNKWDHPERNLTQEEFGKVIEIVDAAIAARQAGGNLAEIEANVEAKLDELWDYMQTLRV